MTFSDIYRKQSYVNALWHRSASRSVFCHVFIERFFPHVDIFQWEPVPYFNNKIICDLVEEKHRGIISVLVSRMDSSWHGYYDMVKSQSLCHVSCVKGWRMSASWRGHRFYIPGEARGEDVRSPSFCHVGKPFKFHLNWQYLMLSCTVVLGWFY